MKHTRRSVVLDLEAVRDIRARAVAVGIKIGRRETYRPAFNTGLFVGIVSTWLCFLLGVLYVAIFHG